MRSMSRGFRYLRTHVRHGLACSLAHQWVAAPWPSLNVRPTLGHGASSGWTRVAQLSELTWRVSGRLATNHVWPVFAYGTPRLLLSDLLHERNLCAGVGASK